MFIPISVCNTLWSNKEHLKDMKGRFSDPSAPPLPSSTFSSPHFSPTSRFPIIIKIGWLILLMIFYAANNWFLDFFFSRTFNFFGKTWPLLGCFSSSEISVAYSDPILMKIARFILLMLFCAKNLLVWEFFFFFWNSIFRQKLPPFLVLSVSPKFK